jgi:predicted metalloprotease
MRWQSGRRSSNVQDRRGMRVGLVGGGIGTVVMVIIAALLGVNPTDVIQMQQTEPAATTGPRADDPEAEFSSVVLAYTEDTWNGIFADMGSDYREPTLVLFEQAVQSACGMAGSAVGPFYCPLDEKLYLDLSFFRDLQERFGAAGDFARAYVIAHEVGHHVQTLMGVSEKVRSAQSAMSREDANALSVRMELQADCFSGIWAHDAQRRNVLDPGDIDEALRAASAIGDDRLQRQAQGHVVPESFTHGTSEQRARWFRRGFESGELRRCDTFSAETL